MSKNKLGLCSLTTLVAGNMIGSGIFLLPADLANIGSISLLSWVITAAGAFLLAIVFSKMSMLIPKSGGPYVYAQAGFGDFIGFQTAYNYWIAVWVGNAAIVIGMVGYLAVFWPALHHTLFSCLTSIVTIWVLTFVNVMGVRYAGFVQIITTILKFIPIVLVAILGWRYFHPEYLFNDFNVTNNSNFTALSNAATLTLWAFIGLESATIPSNSVENPERNIPLATLLGTLLAAIAYIASSTAIMGMLPMHILASNTSPFAAAAGIIFGSWGKWLVAAGAAISCFGCLNGWILLQGQIPMAAANDSFFPKIFAKKNSAGIPACGLIITSILITLLLLLTSSHNLIKQFQTIVLIATLASLLPYLYTSVSEIILLKQRDCSNKKMNIFVAILASIYSFWAIFGTGELVVFYGSMLIMTSFPLYALIFWQK